MSALEESRELVAEVEGTEGWIEVAYDSDSEGWDWSAITIFYSPSARRYFWYSDGGCSCNWHMDYVKSLGDFEDGDKSAVLKEACRWSAEFQAEVRKFDPRKL
jgi:hypothetical protein